MSVIEKLSAVSDTITNIINFAMNDELVKPDFNEYLTAVSAADIKEQALAARAVPYIFERRLTPERKTILQLYKEKNPELSETENEIIECLKTSMSSVFEIRRTMSSGFELYNLLNEKTYKVLSLVKMNNYRGIFPGQSALCRIFKMQEDYYLLEMSNVLSSIYQEEVYKYAAAKIIEKPEDAYEDNPEKEARIESIVKDFGIKFKEFFKTQEVITTSQYADDLINKFNDYCETGTMPDEDEIKADIKSVETNRYFTVSDFKNSYSNFMEKSMEGFSSHSDVYDIGIIYNDRLGLFVLPFWQTFCKIYEADDYKTIQGYKDCVKSFLENDKVPADIIIAAAEKYPRFIERTNEILETNYTLDELIKCFKADSAEKKIYSSASVLYASKIFEKVMKKVSEHVNETAPNPEADYSKTGRNDKCPCGSGKKFKNCCLGKVQNNR